jgi:site-specific DNA-methyltransferase (adenine-specific)
VNPYYADDTVTLYLGDCREVTEWLAADVLVTDPPYGMDWKRGVHLGTHAGRGHKGIAGDADTGMRDAALTLWGDRLAVSFATFDLPKPPRAAFTLVYRKAPDSGSVGGRGGFRKDIEAVYLLGPWPSCFQGRSSVLETRNRVQGGTRGIVTRYGHPHAKPVDVMETLIGACPPGTIADPFAGSGSTLVAARNLGRKAIGVEIDERYAERAAKRLCQDVLITGAVG